MDTFYALAEPTRRNIIEMLAYKGKLSASQISNKFSISAPAISQHLKVLREANLVQVEKKAQQRLYTINTSAFIEVEDWAAKITQLWNERFDRLEAFLQREQSKSSK